jgi:hypothetical protein
MNDDQFAVIRQSALRDTLTALLGAVIILWLALRSWRMVAAVFFSSMIGLAVTAALALALLCTMSAAVLFQPVLMGRPRQIEENSPLGATAHFQSSRITFRYRKSARINSLQERNLSEGQRDQHRAAGLQAFTNVYHVLLACETKTAQILELPGHS